MEKRKMENILRKENLKKGAVVTIAILMVLSNVIPMVFGDSDSDNWGNSLKDNISYTKTSGGYCKITAQGGKVGIKFPYVDSDILSIYLYKVDRLTFDYTYIKNGKSYSYSGSVTNINKGKKVFKITIPAGTTDFALEDCEARFKFNSALLLTGLWSWTVPKYQYLGPISDYK